MSSCNACNWKCNKWTNNSLTTNRRQLWRLNSPTRKSIVSGRNRRLLYSISSSDIKICRNCRARSSTLAKSQQRVYDPRSLKTTLGVSRWADRTYLFWRKTLRTAIYFMSRSIRNLKPRTLSLGRPKAR